MISSQQITNWEKEIELLQELLRSSIAERQRLSDENSELRKTIDAFYMSIID